ncbi:hypothetical protein AVEN_253484-1 [Araneus ventricosus]|uniref:Uncharacterized protein n=1 Tax=Araneus ventricosus TaxID=182803 RepID=A0A4Y2BUI9_ARAVE|nr:hypothetical protein AVEN_253484-1 [Araneus ventricosus]
MSSLCHEVESEEMINLDREGFVKNSGLFKGNKGAVLDTTDMATTAMLVSTNSSYDGTSTASLRELWDNESLGIREPIKNVSKKKAFAEQLKESHVKLTVLPDGRYEVELPWKLDARTNLPDNKELALK